MYCLMCAREGIISAAPCGREGHNIMACLATAGDIATDAQRRLRGKAFPTFEIALPDGENNSGRPITAPSEEKLILTKRRLADYLKEI